MHLDNTVSQCLKPLPQKVQSNKKKSSSDFRSEAKKGTEAAGLCEMSAAHPNNDMWRPEKCSRVHFYTLHNGLVIMVTGQLEFKTASLSLKREQKKILCGSHMQDAQ